MNPSGGESNDTEIGVAYNRIFIVEDDAQYRRVLGIMLGEGWQIREFGDAEAAWQAALEAPPDLVLTDVVMPIMDGISLLRRLRGHPKTQTIPVILISGWTGEQTIRAIEAGADDYLVKPFTSRELLTRVRARLEITAMRRRNAQQEEALASLERQNRWTEGLLDSLPIPLLLLEPSSGRVLFANRAAVRMAGIPLPTGTLLSEVGHLRRSDAPCDTDCHPLREILCCADDLSPRKGLRLTWQTEGGAFELLGDCEVLPAEHGHPLTLVLTLLDVSGLVRVESALRQSVRIRDEFLSIASHELRTPLTTLDLQATGLLRIFESEYVVLPKSSRLHQRLSSIQNQVKRLGRLVDDLLDVGRLAEGRLVTHPEQMDLVVAAQEAIDESREQARRAGSTIHLRAERPIVGHWDRMRMVQVITNLLTNAIKFGRGERIDVVVEGNGGGAIVRVSDHGVGISPDAIPRIFDRFERACSKLNYPGLGLGLWIARQIVEASGGTISVESEVSVGSTFSFKVPWQGADGQAALGSSTTEGLGA